MSKKKKKAQEQYKGSGMCIITLLIGNVQLQCLKVQLKYLIAVLQEPLVVVCCVKSSELSFHFDNYLTC